MHNFCHAFNTLAHTLITAAQQSQLPADQQEAMVRSAIHAAYYSCYHLMVQYLIERGLLPAIQPNETQASYEARTKAVTDRARKGNQGSHEVLIEMLRAELPHVARNMRALKQQRVNADYIRNPEWYRATLVTWKRVSDLCAEINQASKLAPYLKD